MAMATPGPVRVAFWQATVFRRFWVSNLLASFVQPLLYLLGLGVGVGALVDRTARSTEVLGGVSYVAYIAPGPDGHHRDGRRVDREPVADPRWLHLEPRVLRHLGNPARPEPTSSAATRCGWPFGAWSPRPRWLRCWCCSPTPESWGLIPSVPIAAFTGVAFAMPLMAFSAPRKLDGGLRRRCSGSWSIPLFLFGGAFYPISQLPEWTQVIIKILPLWHGVELARGFTVGDSTASTTIAHIVVPCAWIIAGTLLSYRFVRRRLYV